MDTSVYYDLFEAGLFPLPIMWDVEKKIASKHPEHDLTKIIIDKNYVDGLLKNGFGKANGMAIKLVHPLCMLDFDSKNTDNKKIFEEWLQIISNTQPDVLSRLCIERTRSGGHHVYFKHKSITHKMPIARNKGLEVVSIYAGELLSYCYPTPGYSLIHNEFGDIDFITDDELELFITTCATFNEDHDYKPGESTIKLAEYPAAYENVCIQFDDKITDEAFDGLLNSIELYRVPGKHRTKYVPYLRHGSVANYSAKVYFKSKRVLIFSASMPKFPNWHDSTSMGDTGWSLTPSKIVFYNNDRDWISTIEEINMICESAEIDIIQSAPVTNQPLISEDRLKFPYDVFPDWIHRYIDVQTIQHDYMAAAILSATATVIGNSAILAANEGFIVKPILYMAIVAPPGASKSPALKAAFSPIEKHDARLYAVYAQSLQRYKEELQTYENSKKKNGEQKPIKPNYPQTLIKDSTIETVASILSVNTMGSCVFSDELSGFLARMNQYKSGDEVQKWLEMYDGSPMLIQRMSREETRIEEPVCSVVGGIQPGVLETLSKGDNEFNGFFHRFLFCYPKPQQKPDWHKLVIPGKVKHDYFRGFEELFLQRSEQAVYYMAPDAEALYADYFKHKNHKYNHAVSDHARGIIAKYQTYCLRFALILQVVDDLNHRTGIITRRCMEGAVRLTEYFFGNMHKAIKILVPETPVDKMPEHKQKLYEALPQAFSQKTLIETAEKLGIKSNTAKTFLHRDGKELFVKKENGYEKIY